MPLGAKPGEVRTFFIWRSMRFVLLGVLTGVCVTSFATRLIANQIWAISRHDQITFLAVITVLTGIGLLASYMPSLRAARTILPFVSELNDSTRFNRRPMVPALWHI